MRPSVRTAADSDFAGGPLPDHRAASPNAPVGNCPECEYDLRGAPGARCPWCGWEIDPAALAAMRRGGRSGHRWSVAATAAVFGVASLVGIASLIKRGRGFGMLDGFSVLAVAAAGFGHLALAGLALRNRRHWPMRSGEGAALLRFVGWCCVVAAVIGATQALHPSPIIRGYRGMPISGVLEFVVRAVFQMLPGGVLLVLTLLAFRRSGRNRKARTDGRFIAPSATTPSTGSAAEFAPFTVEFLRRYTPGQVTQSWHDTPRYTTASLEREIAGVWEAELAVARREGRPLFNASLARLLGAEADPAHLRLDLGPTCYRDFLATNLRDAERFRAIDPAALADAVGVSATVTTPDGFLAFGRRSRHVAYHAGMVHPFGGMLEGADRGSDATFDLFGCTTRELCEEIGLEPRSIEHATIVALVRDRTIHQPEMMFDVTVMLSRDALLARMGALPGEHEHTGIEFVHDDPDAVSAFLLRARSVTPVCQAAMLLHGFHSWGAAWYEQTCYVLYGEVPRHAQRATSLDRAPGGVSQGSGRTEPQP